MSPCAVDRSHQIAGVRVRFRAFAQARPRNGIQAVFVNALRFRQRFLIRHRKSGVKREAGFQAHARAFADIGFRLMLKRRIPNQHGQLFVVGRINCDFVSTCLYRSGRL